MMTINEYRLSQDTKFPTNGEGYLLPQLIDDLWNARQALIFIRTETKYTIVQSEALCNAIGYLNRSLTQLGIQL